jgi:two-component system LytT family response regulator
MRVIIAEDEQIAREAIVAMANVCGLEVVAECQDGTEAIRCLRTHQADVLFLDVQMPGIDGFGVLQEVPPDRLPAVIFTTAYDQYAVQAFEHNAVDYLLKPFDEDRFRKALERAKVQLSTVSNQLAVITRLANELQQANGTKSIPQRLVVRSKGKVELLRIDEIDWIEADHNYLRIHVGNQIYSYRQTIGEFESRLRPDKFLRIHRSLLVNVDRIRSLQACGYGEYLVILQNGKNLPLSRTYRDRLDCFLEKVVASMETPQVG